MADVPIVTGLRSGRPALTPAATRRHYGNRVVTRIRTAHIMLAMALIGPAVTGCAFGSDASDAGTSTSPASSASPAASASGAASGSPPSAPSSTVSTQPALVLTPDGLALVVDATVRPLDFGADRTGVISVMTSQLGPVRTNELPECGQGPRTSLRAGVLVVLFDGDSFVGWQARGVGEPPLATQAGIGVGSTLAEVNAAYEVSVSNDTLGPEFFSRDGQFGGFLTGESPNATVTELHAGETCFFR